MFFWLISFLPIPVVATSNCIPDWERTILDNLFNLDFIQANTDLKTAPLDSALIPSKSFYQALINWYSQVNASRNKPTEINPNRLLKEVAVLESQYRQNPTLNTRFAWNLASAVSARALLANKQVRTAYKIGLEAVENLETDLQDPQISEQQYAAGRMMIGLYYLYSNFIPKQFAWLKSSILSKGSFDDAVVELTYATQHSQIFSTEAARTLLIELPWRTPGHCRYLNIEQTLSQQYPNNADISLIYQGLAIRCGYPERARVENRRLTEHLETGLAKSYETIDIALLNKLARYRINANLGLPSRDKNTNASLIQHRRYALANAYDIMGERALAIDIYQSLVDSTEISRSIRISSKARLKTPFQAKETISDVNSLTLPQCSEN